MLRSLTAAIRQLSLFDRVAPSATPVIPSPTLEPPHPEPPPTGGAESTASTLTASAPTVSAAEPAFASLCRGPYAHVRVEAGSRLRDSWKVTWTRRQEALLLRVPPRLEDAPLTVKHAALAWAVLVSKRTRKVDPTLRQERRRFESMIRDFLQASPEGENPGRRSRRLESNRRRLARLNAKGQWHDLDAILSDINATYFDGKLQARITWAARLGGLSTHRMAEDGEGRPYHLITISRGYDCPEATADIVGGVVYHECLHAIIPPRTEGGRRVVHGRDFRLRERQYAQYAEWRKWHREGLTRSLRRMLRQAATS